jgi:hypothetical protein
LNIANFRAEVQLPCIISGATLTINPIQGLQGSKKRTLSVDATESDEAVGDEKLAVPFWFDDGYSTVRMEGSDISVNKEVTEEDSHTVQPLFTGLPGLEKQLQQLTECVQRVNLQLEEHLRQLAGCVPILLLGSSGSTTRGV